MGIAPHDRVFLRLKWHHQAQFAGYYLAKDQGFYQVEGLSVTVAPGGPGVDPEREVASGAADFAQAGGTESLLAARDAGLPVVAIGAMFQKIDVAFVAKKQSGITKLADFPGRVVSTWYTGVHLILRALLSAAGLDPASIVEVAQTASLMPFLRDDVAIAAATFFNQLPQLCAHGLTDLTIFDPADYGIIFPRDTIITSENVMTQRPDVAERFLRASLRGWRHAVENQREAVNAVMRHDPALDRGHQAVMLQEVAKLMLWGSGTTRGIGFIDPAGVDLAHDFLLKNGQIGRPVNLDQAYTLRFWERACTPARATHRP
jgi:NitT/TauT family transport system substrate-binding protein